MFHSSTRGFQGELSNAIELPVSGKSVPLTVFHPFRDSSLAHLMKKKIVSAMAFFECNNVSLFLYRAQSELQIFVTKLMEKTFTIFQTEPSFFGYKGKLGASFLG